MLTNIRLNAWGRFGHPKNGKLRRRYARCCTEVIVGVNARRDRTYRHFYKIDQYAESFAHAQSLGLEVSLMAWVRPDEQWIRSMVPLAASLIEATGVGRTVLLDLEGCWSRGWLAGKKPRTGKARDMERARLALILKEEFGRYGLRYAVTDVPMCRWATIAPLVQSSSVAHPELHTSAVVALRARPDDGGLENVRRVLPGAAFVMPQTHEFAGPRRWYRRPGRLVKWTAAHWSKRLDSCTLIRPSLEFHQAFYGLQTRTSVRKSLEACTDHGATAIGGWTGRNFGCRPARYILAMYRDEIAEERRRTPRPPV